MLENFASGLAHEIGNPLGVIRTTIQSIQEDFDEAHSLWQTMDRVIHEIDKLNKIVKDFNALGRPSPPNFSEHNLRDVLTGLMPLIYTEAKQKQIEVVTDFEEEEGRVWVDSQQIQQVLLNLILNAFQALPDGGKLVFRIQPVSQDNQGYVAIAVQDNGPGIAAENLDRIFEPFFTTKSKGSGLGLSLAKAIVHENGGRITIESQWGTGSTFTLLFPSHT